MDTQKAIIHKMELPRGRVIYLLECGHWQDKDVRDGIKKDQRHVKCKKCK